MIVFDLACRIGGHRFEGWFGSSADFDAQIAAQRVACPMCASVDVIKAPMAPNLARKGNTASAPAAQVVTGATLAPEAQRALAQLAALQAKVLEQSTWVGPKFAEQSRAIHYGERTAEPIHGEATADEAEALRDEGIAIAALPFPVIPPEQAN